MNNDFRRLFVLVLLLVLLNTFSYSQNSSGYHLLTKYEIGGEGGWDYLYADSNAHRLYVSRSTRVVIIDTDKGTVIGEIPNTNGVHGIAIAEEFGRGFTSNGRDNTVTIFDLKTLKAIGTAPTGKNPDAIIYEPASKRIFTFNGSSANTTAIDAETGKVAGTIELGGKPEAATFDGKGMVWVNIEDKSQIVAFDSKKLEVKNRWPLAPGEEPTGMAIDVKKHRLFSVCGNKKMIVLDNQTGKIVADVPVGEGTDGAAFDPEMKLAFSSNGAGTLTVVHEDSDTKFSVVDSLPTQRGARTISLDPKTHRVYLSAARYGDPPAPTAQNPRPRAPLIPNSFVILVFGK